MRWTAVVVLLLLSGCGGGSPAAPSAAAPLLADSPRASLEVSIDASPVTGGSRPGDPLTARWRVVIRETAGVGGSVVFLNSSLRDASSGAKVLPKGSISLSQGDIVARAGTARIPGGGSLSVEESLEYTLPSGGRAATLAVALQFADDNGHLVTATAAADIR